MSKENTYYSTSPMVHTLSEVMEYVNNGKKEYGCVCEPLLNIPIDHVIPDELHLLLRITDVLLTNLLDDAMERDEKEDNVKTRGMEKGLHLKAIVQLINDCGVTFTIWEKQDSANGATMIEWTSLMGDEKKKLLTLLPEKLANNSLGIHTHMSDTVVQIWKVLFYVIIRSTDKNLHLLIIFYSKSFTKY